jgi:hypothetical protein
MTPMNDGDGHIPRLTVNDRASGPTPSVRRAFANVSLLDEPTLAEVTDAILRKARRARREGRRGWWLRT